MKKRIFALICLLLALSLAGCAKVNSDNSFQDQAAGEVSAVPPAAQNATDTQNADSQNAEPQATEGPTAVPTSDPNAAGYNG